MEDYRQELKKAETIVIKVGTSTITYNTGRPNLTVLEKLVFIISDLMNQGKKAVLVTSGAIGVGNSRLGHKDKPEKMSEKQAAAAIGQCELMNTYGKLFSEYGYNVGQILLTREEIEVDKRKENVINTFETLLKYGVVPIVNENDSIATEEIEFGDNDTLSAIVAKLVGADLLIILSDIEGMYENDPRIDKNAKMISIVKKIDEKIEKSAGTNGTDRGTGGMITKISAAKIAVRNGTNVVIASGSDPYIIRKIVECQEVGTLFIADREVVNRKNG